jgi:hypothetical protein
VLISYHFLYPDLTVGPIHCQAFGPLSTGMLELHGRASKRRQIIAAAVRPW